MKTDLGFVSFDFDLTLTRNHSWNDCGLYEPANEGDFLLNLVNLQNAPLLARLIRGVCREGLLFCITSRQYTQTIFYALKRTPDCRDVIGDYYGWRFFIFGREYCDLGKAPVLREILGDIGGVHFDDDKGEKAGFFGYHRFRRMDPGTAFRVEETSGLMKGLRKIPQRFSGLASVDIDRRYAASQPVASSYPALAEGGYPLWWRQRPDLTIAAFVERLRSDLLA